MKYIFLDIDGVLNNSRTQAISPDGYVGISSELVKRLAKIVKSTDAKIVLTSTWKKSDDEDFRYLTRKLAQAHLFLSGKTKEPNNSLSLRGQGIKAYLKEHECETYVILDDEYFDFKDEEILNHAIITNANDGLTQKDVEKAIAVLNGELVNPEEYKDYFLWGYHH